MSDPTDIAARIREALDHQESCGWHHDWPEALVALRAVLDKCDKVSVDNWGEPHFVGMAFAAEFHNAIAKGLALSDSPAEAGSQPTPAGEPTLTDPLIVAIGQELAGQVWDPPLPKLPIGQWMGIVEVIARCVRECDEEKRWIDRDKLAEVTADAAGEE